VCNNNVGVLGSNAEESETSGNEEDISDGEKSAVQCNGMCGCERRALTMRTVKTVVLRSVGTL
jgi:hypothetical protein